jgi:hypothetical protein
MIPLSAIFSKIIQSNLNLSGVELSLLYKAVSKIIKDAVASGRGYWTRYEHISKLFKDILAHMEELKYKWSFLNQLCK